MKLAICSVTAADWKCWQFYDVLILIDLHSKAAASSTHCECVCVVWSGDVGGFFLSCKFLAIFLFSSCSVYFKDLFCTLVIITAIANSCCATLPCVVQTVREALSRARTGSRAALEDAGCSDFSPGNGARSRKPRTLQQHTRSACVCVCVCV